MTADRTGASRAFEDDPGHLPGLQDLRSILGPIIEPLDRTLSPSFIWPYVALLSTILTVAHVTQGNQDKIDCLQLARLQLTFPLEPPTPSVAAKVFHRDFVHPRHYRQPRRSQPSYLSVPKDSGPPKQLRNALTQDLPRIPDPESP